MRKCLALLLLIIIFQYLPNRVYGQIDVPKWMNDIGGPNTSCISSGVQVDKQNNVYVTGLFSETVDFDPSSGVYNLTASSTYDTFLAKYTTDGKLIWVIKTDGGNITQVNSLAVDKDGNPIISGQFDENIDVDPGPGVTTLSTHGGNDAFVIKYSTAGALMWAKAIGGTETDFGGHVSVDSQGNVIECVRYEASVTIGNQTYNSRSNSSFNGLTVKYDSKGNLLWVINLGDNSHSESDFSGIDSKDNIIVTGHFEGNDNFNPLGTAVNLNGNSSSIFIAKYNANGILSWVKSFNGTAGGSTAIVCVNSKDEIFVDGPFTGTTNFTQTNSVTSVGGGDLYLAKYSSAGDFVSAKDIGGVNSTVTNYGILSSQDDYVYISGYFKGTIDFDPSPATTAALTYHGQQDFFLAKYDDDLNYKYAFNGGNDACTNNLGRALGIDNNNALLFTGSFCSTVNFSASSCSPLTLTAQSSIRDCFLGKYVQNTATTASEITGFSVPQQSAPAVIDQTNLTITVTVPAGTDITSLVPTITYAGGATLSPASGTAKNFTAGVTYTLTTDCATLNYTVTVISNAPHTQILTCSGSTTVLKGITESTPPDSYLWQILQGTTWVSAGGTNNAISYTTAPLINTTNANMVFSFRRQSITAGVTTYDSYYDVSVRPALIAPIVQVPALCRGSVASLSISNVQPGYDYVWYNAPAGGNILANGSLYTTPALNANADYYISVSDRTCPLVSRVPVHVHVTPLPAAPDFFTEQICAGNSATIVLAETSVLGTYNWYDSPAKTNLVYTGVGYVTPPLSVNTKYYVEFTDSLCTAATLAVETVEIVPPPAAPQVSNANTSICEGGVVTFRLDNPQTGFTYHWYTAATGGTVAGTGIDFTTPALSANTSYYVEAANAGGCISPTRTPVNITVSPPPDVTATNASTCPNTGAVLTAQSTDANAAINWYADAAGGAILFTGTNYTTPVLSANTSYYAEAIDKTTQCISTQRAVATASILQPLATPVVTAGATTPTEVTFQWVAVDGATGYKISIDNGVTYTDPSSGSNGLTHTISGLQKGQSITILVEAIGASGCETSNTGTATALAQYPQNSIVYVANAFTPNNDGKNDIVYVHGDAIQSMTFRVYNQFGELIFTSASLSSGWDGTFKGTKQPVGVYVYYVQAQLFNGQKVNKKGTITLLR